MHKQASVFLGAQRAQCIGKRQNTSGLAGRRCARVHVCQCISCVLFVIVVFQHFSYTVGRPSRQPISMGKSLMACAFFVGIAFDLACAGSHDTLEPYQVLDIRMEEGVKDVLASRHGLGEPGGKMSNAAFLASPEENDLHSFASIAAAQKADSASLSKLVEHFKGR
jgi:hypothetical protein